MNDLVVHVRRDLGIGCVARVRGGRAVVNFGLRGSISCKPELLRLVPTDGCATCTAREYSDRVLRDAGPDRVIVGNELRQFVGIGWITERVVTEADLLAYPRLV